MADDSSAKNEHQQLRQRFIDLCAGPTDLIYSSSSAESRHRHENPDPLVFQFKTRLVTQQALNLSNLKCHALLVFENIDFKEAVNLDFGIFKQSVIFQNCSFAKGFTCKLARFESNLYITDCFVEVIDPSKENTALTLRSVHVVNQCDLSGTTINGDLNLTRLTVGNSLLLRFRKESKKFAIVNGDLVGPDMRISKLCDFGFLNVAKRLDLDRCEIGSSLSFMDRRVDRNDIEHQNSSSAPQLPWVHEEISLRGASIGQTLDFRGGSCGGIDLTNGKVGGHLRFDSGESHLVSSKFSGRVRFDGAKIGGNVNLDNGWFEKGITAEGVVIGGSLSLMRTKEWPDQCAAKVGPIEDETYTASFWAIYAQIGGSLLFSGMEFESAVNLARCRIGNNWYIQDSSGNPDLKCKIGAGNLTVSLGKPYSECVAKASPEHTNSLELVTLFTPEAQVTGSLYWTHLETLDGPVIGEGLSCFQIKLSKNTTFKSIVDLAGATIHNDLDVREAKFEKGLYLTSATLSGNLLGTDTEFGRLGEDICPPEWFEKNSCDNSDVEPWADFVKRFPVASLTLVNATILGFVDLRAAVLKGPINGDFVDCSASIHLDSLDKDHQTVVGAGYHSNGYVYSLSLNGANIKGGVYARSVKFEAAIDISVAQISGDLNLVSHLEGVRTEIRGSTCHNAAGPDLLGLWLRATTFGGQVQVREVSVGAGVCMVDCTVQGTVDLHRSEIRWSSHRSGTWFSLDARSCTVHGPLRATGTVLAGDVLLKDSDIAGLQIHATKNQRDSGGADKPMVREAAVVFGDVVGDHTTIKGPVNFTGLVVTGGISLPNSTIHGTFDMQAVPGLVFVDRFGNSNFCKLNALHERIFKGDSKLGNSVKFVEPDDMTDVSTYCGTLRNEKGISMMMQGVRVHGSLYLRGLYALAGVNFRSIHVMGALALDPVKYKGPTVGAGNQATDLKRVFTRIGNGTYRDRRFSLRLSNATVDSHFEGDSLQCKGGISLTNSKINSDIRLRNITCQDGAWLNNEHQNASLLLDLLEAGGDVTVILQDVGLGGISAKGVVVGKDLSIRLEGPATEIRKGQSSTSNLEYFLDLKRVQIPGKLTVDLCLNQEKWLNVTQATVGEFIGCWLRSDYKCGFFRDIARYLKTSLHPEKEIFFALDLFEFKEIGFENGHFRNKDWTDYFLGALALTAVSLFCLIALLFRKSDHIETLLLPIAFTVYGLAILFRLILRSMGDTSKSIISRARDQYLNADIFARHSTFSERFYVHLIDYFASSGFRDQTDRMFRSMKSRELKVDSSFTGVATNWLINASTASGYVVVCALLLFEVGICAEDSYVGHPSAWASSASLGKSGASDNNSPAIITAQDAMLAPLKHMIPFAKLDELDEVKPAESFFFDPLHQSSPAAINDDKLIHPSKSTFTLAGKFVSSKSAETKKPNLPLGSAGTDVDVQLKGVIQDDSEVTKPTAKPAPIQSKSSVKMGYLYFLLSVVGYAGISALVLSVAGLFRRHRYLGSID